MKILAALSVLALCLAPAALNAQTSAPATSKCPCANAEPPKSQWEIDHEKQLKEDWPWLGRYAEANAALPAPAMGEKRIVFMGDSITEGWHLDQSFPGKPYLNRGISGQTTPQMVLRFHQDVVALKPKAVVILAGTNDLAGNTGLATNAQIEDNLAAMAEIAHANGIKVIFCSILPVFDYPWRPGLKPAPRILAINNWLKDYAAAHNDLYVDYHSAMKDAQDGLPPSLAKDGVHPNAAGYAIMAPLVQSAIEQAEK